MLEQHVSFQQVSVGDVTQKASCLLQGRMKHKRAKLRGWGRQYKQTQWVDLGTDGMPVQQCAVSRAADSQSQAAGTPCMGRATRASLSLLRPELALSQLKIRKTSKEAAAEVPNCWPVLLEQCKSCERDQLRKWRRQAAPVLTNNPVRPSRYTPPQTPPTEATLRGTKKSIHCFPLNMSQTSPAQWTTLSCTPWKITDYQNL